MKKGKEKRRKITLKKGKKALKMHLFGLLTPNKKFIKFPVSVYLLSPVFPLTQKCMLVYHVYLQPSTKGQNFINNQCPIATMVTWSTTTTLA